MSSFDSQEPPQPNGSGLKAVVDIGSNSVRMVVFKVGDGDQARVPVPISNERALCGLGRGFGPGREQEGQGFRLDPHGVRSAILHLRRFVSIGRKLGVESWHVLATEAVRSADDGDEFVARVEKIIGAPVSVLSGDEEAEASALGVISGIPDANGMMGDLGGGSLEIVALNRGDIGQQTTLPLGVLRLDAIVGRDMAKARTLVDKALSQVDWLGDVVGRNFYPVGGAWRAFAGLHMAHTDYPLHVIHGYSLSRQEALDVLRLVANLGPESLGQIPGISKSRLSTLPLAAVVMEGLLARANPARVIFSAHGLREGWLYKQLGESERARDPLVIGCADWAGRVSRFGGTSEFMGHWIDPLFPGEDPAYTRVRRAAAMLSEICWRDHPDYRADGSFSRVLHMSFSGISHPERIMLAFAVSARYGGEVSGSFKDQVAPLIGEYALDHAMLIGRALQFANTLSGGVDGILENANLELSHKELTLRLPEEHAYLISDICQQRLSGLARRLGRQSVIAH
ncbi:MAG: Ppx/GppA family phosphatase [Rhodospirillales bacterium]|nr:Ppx/GppA family phosphatase [Rhodospirillales bacterium]MBT4007502.1 Ppx/GppA family phosphatase [Rhodospirillales bacterium]MBT5075702.1 Ppx/GppA family phosphatase [Rhodospirillales bacterium]MBT5113216.1 Ppx/GppA family phosphatase [Rhodospirillales bacterium]MBT5671849.1 Ppx/GppA family phosphatase [Rhodospirillales bacterium]